MAENWKSPETPFFDVTGNGWTLILLEAWRRGIGVELRPNRGFRLFTQDREQTFKLSRLDQESTSVANRIVSNKEATKALLGENGVRSPRGFGFAAPFNRQAIVASANEIGYPVALKANNWSKGRGVFSRVEDEASFQYYLSSLIDDLGCKHLLVEEHVRGTDFRFYVVGDEVVGVIRKVPAHIIGDGSSSVAELIDNKNGSRNRNPYLRNALIRVDSEVEKLIGDAGLSLSCIPDLDQRVYLRAKSNVSAGGDSVDYTSSASESAKRLAISAVSALPGVSHGGVDILIENAGTERESAVVLEINAAAELGLHLFPAEGAPRNIPKSLIDHYFPTSTYLQSKSEYWYFDFKAAVSPILQQVATSVELTPLPSRPMEKWVSVRYEGDVQRVGFRKWVSNRAQIARVHGEVANTDDGAVVAQLCGTSRGLEKLTSDRTGLPKSAIIESVTVVDRPPFVLTPGVSIL